MTLGVTSLTAVCNYKPSLLQQVVCAKAIGFHLQIQSKGVPLSSKFSALLCEQEKQKKLCSVIGYLLAICGYRVS